MAEAAVVGCEEVDGGRGRDVGERAVGVGAPALGDGTGVAMDYGVVGVSGWLGV